MTTGVQASETGTDTALSPSVRLDTFEGPLDVLLHLIRDQKMDIFDIPIANLTVQYLEILDAQQPLDLEFAGDYLVMASTLTQIKSRMLLPRPELDEEGEIIDPRAELVAQLLAYEQYRAAAEELNEYPRLERDIFVRSVFPEAGEIERPLPEPDLDGLLLAFRQVLKRVGGEVRQHVFMDTMSVREQMTFVLERLKKGGIMLEELLDRPGREIIVITFLAILELWREQAITVVQDVCFGSISILPKARASEISAGEGAA
ncbi:MAG: segregation/condensation protein A [Mariprofundaceae bacterium]|nr:segregation/condensation protein A [Mariprofundaceae bacterium]